jgi:hypothetical protein
MIEPNCEKNIFIFYFLFLMKRITQDSISSPLAKKIRNRFQEISFINGFPIVPKVCLNFPIFFNFYFRKAF